MRILRQDRAQKRLALRAESKVYPLSGLDELIALEMVAKQQRDGPGLRALLAPAWV